MALTPPPTRRRRRIAVLVATVAVAATTFAAIADSAAGATPTSTDAAAYARTIFSMINSERQAHGAAAVTRSIRLDSAAAQHNYWMATRNTLSHQLSGEHSLGYRVSACNYAWRALGENLGATADWSRSGVIGLQSKMYAEGPGGGHYDNVMNSTYRNVGISVRIDTAHHKAWLTVDFGRLM